MNETQTQLKNELKRLIRLRTSWIGVLARDHDDSQAALLIVQLNSKISLLRTLQVSEES